MEIDGLSVFCFSKFTCDDDLDSTTLAEFCGIASALLQAIVLLGCYFFRGGVF